MHSFAQIDFPPPRECGVTAPGERALHRQRAFTIRRSEGSLVAVVRRIAVRAVLGTLVASGLVALGSFTQTAAAKAGMRRPETPADLSRRRRRAPAATRPDAPPPINPDVNLDLARQTTDRSNVRIAGWTADGDFPLTSLTVQISIDGSHAKTLTADTSRPDVGAHGYDVVIPASSTAKEVCVTAVNVGSGTNSKACRQVDDVVEFNANGIDYDRANATITATNLDQLDKVTNTNQTTVQQSTTISGQRVVTDTQSWSGTVGLKVTANGGIKIPFLADGKITVEGSVSYTHHGSSSTARTFAWQQPVLVPAKSRGGATVAVTRSKLVVPYTMAGTYLYRSGHREPGSTSGTYSGINSHDLEVKIAQFNLDGTPAARPVDQPEATLLEEG